MKGKSRAVALPSYIYEKIEQRIAETEFSSVDEYVSFILEEVLKEENDSEDSAFSKEDEEQVKSRLRGLGYMD